MTVEEIAKSLEELLEQSGREQLVVAVDGRCAAGKTTLAGELSERLDAGIVQMDDFFLPKKLRTPERLAEAGGNVHYERFISEVLPQLTGRRDKPFCYRRFDCQRMVMGEMRKVKASRITLVEGAYSCHPKLGNYMDYRIFADVEENEQRNRIRKRNGSERLEVFISRWIPMEERYFQEYHIREGADCVFYACIPKRQLL